jgi:large subunit ribosomal protein L29
MSITDLRQMETNELLHHLETKRDELFKLRLNWHAGSLENPNQMRAVRKEIAQILTLLREREIAREILGEEANGE